MSGSRYHFVLALLRIVTGFIVWQHGAQALFGMLGGSAALPLTWPWLVGGVEFFGGMAIAVGVLTRPFALAIAVDMAVLYVTQFLPLGFPPIVNRQGEVACLLFNTNLLLAFTGPGRWSVEGGGGRRTPVVLGIVRIFMGLLFLSYGLRKMFGLLGGEAEVFLSLQWFAGIVELFGGLALIAGAADALDGVPVLGTNGLRLLHQPQSARILPNREWRRAGGAVLLFLPVCLGSRRWAVERGWVAAN